MLSRDHNILWLPESNGYPTSTRIWKSMTDTPWRDPEAEFERRATGAFMADPNLADETPTSTNSGAKPDATAELPRVLDRSDPLACGRRFLADEFTHDNQAILYHHRGDFYRWVRSRWQHVEEGDLRAQLYEYLEGTKAIGKNKNLEPFKPTARRVTDILDALRGAVHLSSGLAPPTWLKQVPDLLPNELIPCCNGLLHVPEMCLLGHDVDFFNTSALDVAYDPKTSEPTQWLAFLRSLWEDDSEAIATLEEMFGYLLTTDTRQQKIFMLVGPKRSGKGTIARVLTALLGRENVAGPTLGSLATNFGLSPLIGKPLAIISDARLGSRSDQAVIVERLLSISGEDIITIDRKHREPWTGTLPTRFLLLSNELPRLADTSGAMASRFIVLMLKTSFFGREDTELTDKLRTELPNILRWSLDGLQQLRERGRFLQPSSSTEAIQELEDLGSPVGAFVRDRCEIKPGREIACDNLYRAWCSWCTEQGRDHAGTRQRFGRDLRAVMPGLTVKQRREALQVVRVYGGISTV